jgi:arylsulfatase A-like enzyme
MAFRINYRGVFVGTGGPCLIREDQLTLPQMLRDQGYATAMTGKWHVGLTFLDADGNRITQGGVDGVKQIDYSRAIPDAPIHRGFDRFFGTACCPTTDFLYAFIDGDRIPVPPTGPLDKTPLPKHPYANDNRPGLIAPDFDLQEVDLVFLRKSQEFLEDHVQKTPDKPFFLYHCTQAVHLPSFAAPRFHGATQAGPHGDFIHELDWIVGELMQTLERLGVADHTLVFFSSDNGPETTAVLHMRQHYDHDGARPWRGMKRDQWEGGHRVPLIVRWPNHIKPDATTDQTVCLTGVMATCAAITGATLPENAAPDSVSFLPVLRGESGDRPVRDYTLHQTISLALAIRQGPWKYLDHRGSGGNDYSRGALKAFALPDSDPDAPGQLYNLENDPGERTNLYSQRPDVRQRLKELLANSKEQGRSRNLTGDARAGATYETRSVRGWTLHISRALMATEPGLTERAVELLDRQLEEITHVVPQPAVIELQQVPLYFNLEYGGKKPTAEFHPDAGWLRANGRDPAMEKGVEFTNLRIFEQELDRMPNFALHELAHAYHNRVLPGGFENPQIKAAFESARADGKYEKVERRFGNAKRSTIEQAYAMTNPMEYFAECSEAYFVTNDFFPFSRTDLRRFDPEMCDLLEKLWNRTDQTEDQK